MKTRLTVAAAITAASALTGVGPAPAVSPTIANAIAPVSPWRDTANARARADRGLQPFVELGGTNARPAEKIRWVVKGSMVDTPVLVTMFLRCVAGANDEFSRSGGFEKSYTLKDPDGDGVGRATYSFVPFDIDTSGDGVPDVRSRFCHMNPSIYLFREDNPQGGWLSLTLQYRGKVTP